MRGKRHDDNTRAAVMAALLAGQGVGEIARQYKMPQTTVSNIKKELDSEKLVEVGLQKKEKLIDLIELHLTASLKGAARIANKTEDDRWLSKQSADELGVFYGILSDKSIRLAEAAERVLLAREEAQKQIDA